MYFFVVGLRFMLPMLGFLRCSWIGLRRISFVLWGFAVWGNQ